MRIGISSGFAAAAALVLGLSGPPASACEAVCGYGYAPAYYAPPVYAYAQPVVAYAAPPVYSYSYFAPAYGYGHRPVYQGFYTTRINVFRGPRWNFSAAYYTSPPAFRGRRAGVYRFYGPRGYRAHPAYMRGPVFRASRRW